MNQLAYNIKIVCDRLVKLAQADEDDAEVIADELDAMLNGLLSEDFFGTEGQNDPRGDGRDTIQSVRHITL